MGQTLEQINAVRRMKGEEPLSALPSEEANTPPHEISVPPVDTPPTPPVEAKKTEPTEPTKVTSADVLKYLQENGIAVSSLEDLQKPVVVTEADLQKQAEEKENAKLSYGLNKGLVSRKTHEQFILDKSNKQQLVFAQFYQEAKKEDPDLTDEDIQGEFAAKYGLDSEPNTRKYKRGLQEIEILGETILRNKYQNIYKLDSEFENFEKQSSAQKQFEKKILAEAPNYKKVVDQVFVELKKISTKFSDEESYEVEVVDESLNNIKSMLLDQNYVAKKISEGYTAEELKDVAYTALLKENWPVFVKEMINQALLRNQKGVKGIPSGTGLQKPEDKLAHLNDNQKAAFQRLFPNQQPVGAN